MGSFISKFIQFYNFLSSNDESLPVQEDVTECIICMTNNPSAPKEFTCASHPVNYCQICATRINKCPVCRNDKRLINEEYYLMKCRKREFTKPENLFYDPYIENDVWNLQSVPVDHITEKICFEYVSTEPQDLEHVPPIFFTIDLCAIAIQKDWKTFDLVLSKYRIYKQNNQIQWVVEDLLNRVCIELGATNFLCMVTLLKKAIYDARTTLNEW